MGLTPGCAAARSTAIASSRSRGGPNTLSPANCIAPYPIRRTCQEPIGYDPAASTDCTWSDMTSRPVRGQDRAADRCRGFAREERDHLGDRLGRDGVRHRVRWEELTVLRRV